MSFGGGIEILKARVRTSVSVFLVPADVGVELSAPSKGLCLPACHHALNHNDNRLNL